MDDDQQFCLRWNNHQSTLVAVFDTLLENEKLVDCTLAAEGKFLNAHKVVLSACSPYFESLLSRHYDKHPILILKDVKFQELKAMMDYMYRGEVNISQDQLGALLKAAESLQIKGLSDNKREEPAAAAAASSSNKRPGPSSSSSSSVPVTPKSPQQQSQHQQQIPKVQGLTIEQRNRAAEEREGSVSPGPRKKKRMRRKSEDMDNNHHDASNSSDAHSLPSNIPSATTQLPANIKMNSSSLADVPDALETKQEILRHKDDSGSQQSQVPVPIIKEKLETHSELMLEPKAEYVDEMNEDSIEDLTLDDDDLSNMEQMDDGPGPSHGGEGSSQQGFGHWQMGNQSQDEVFLAAQEAVGAHRDSQGRNNNKVVLNCTDDIKKDLSIEIDNDDLVDLSSSVGEDEDEIQNSEMFSISNIHSVLDPEVIVESDFECDLCNTKFRHLSSLRYHRKNRVCMKAKKDDLEQIKVLQCDKCEKIFLTGSGYRYHMRRSVCEQEEEEHKVPQCSICNKIFSTITGLNYHTKRRVCEQQEEIKDEIIQCESCETIFKHKTSLHYHLAHKVCLKPKREEIEVKILQCDQCEKIFSTTAALTYHVKHNVCAKEPKEPKEEEEKECHLCNATFKHGNSLRYHLTHKVCLKPKIDKVEPKVHQCEKCAKIFAAHSSFEYHVKRKVCEQIRPIIPGPPYICENCGTSFDVRQILQIHTKTQACIKNPERYFQEKHHNNVTIKIESD